MKPILFLVIAITLTFISSDSLCQNKSLSGTYKGKIVIKNDPLLQKEVDEKGGMYAILFFTDDQTVEMSSEVFGIPSKGTTATYQIIGKKIHIDDKSKSIVIIRQDGKLQIEDKKSRMILTKIDD